MDPNALAITLDDAAFHARAVPQLSHSHALSLADAYEIQRLSLARRHVRGERLIGMKMGFTSRAKMVQMGLSEMIWGRLTDRMLETEGGQVDRRRYIHPRAEPELCFLTRRPIDRPLHALEAMQYIEAIAPAVEIIDSRYENFKFSLEDVVADNSSSSGLVIGPWSSRRLDFSNLGLAMEFNGRVVQAGSTAAVLGHPLRAFVAATELLFKYEEPLPAGSIVMSGGATAAEYIPVNGYVHLRMQHLATLGFTLSE
jgi:2-oxo-3-hexenedioate decarboxylase